MSAVPSRSGEQRRRELLQTGSELAAQPPPEDAEVRALAHLTVADVAARAGMTRGSLYHLWSSQEAYRHDLMRSLHAPAPVSPDERQATVDSAVAAAVRRTFADAAFRARLSFLPYSRSPAAVDLVVEGESVMLDALMSAIRSELAASGLQLRPEFGDDHLRSSVSAIVQGLAVIGLVRDDGVADADVDLIVRSAQEAVGALLVHFTQAAR